MLMKFYIILVIDSFMSGAHTTYAYEILYKDWPVRKEPTSTWWIDNS